MALYINTKTQRSPLRKFLRGSLIILPIIGLIGGGYALLNIYSPAIASLPQVTGEQSTSDKLETSTAGTHGDRLYIPQINVDVAIVTGSNESVLDQGAWHRKPENGDPVMGGNFVLSAHRFEMGLTPQNTRAKSPFYNIDKLNTDDELYVDYKGERYGYKVTKKYSVTPNQTEIESSSDDAKMTLYSCTLKGASDGRDVIEASFLGKIKTT